MNATSIDKQIQYFIRMQNVFLFIGCLLLLFNQIQFLGVISKPFGRYYDAPANAPDVSDLSPKDIEATIHKVTLIGL